MTVRTHLFTGCNRPDLRVPTSLHMKHILNSATTPIGQNWHAIRHATAHLILTLSLFSLIAVQPVLAQTTGTAFCETSMAQTIKNLFTVIQFGGPLVGGLIALGAIVAIPTVRRADLKKEIKEIRNQALVWGIIVAPLGTAIIQFLLNDVVAGGVSCGF